MEGYMFRMWDGSVWAVKGVEFQSGGRIRAFPRLVGDVKCSGLSCGYDIVREIYPWLLLYDPCVDMETPQIPLSDIASVYSPFSESPETDPDAKRLRRILEEESGVEVGITGSGLIGRGRDIDLVVYGYEESLQVYAALRSLRGRRVLKPLSGKPLVEEYRKNLEDTSIALEEYSKRAAQRLLVGVFEGKPYSIRLVSRKTPRYGCRRAVKICKAEILARIVDSSAGLLTPALYRIYPVAGNPPCIGDVKHLLTYRIRYMELPEGALIRATGYVEYVSSLGYVLVPDHPGGGVTVIGYSG